MYRICPYRGWAQIQAGAQVEAGDPSSESLIKAGSRIEAGSGIHTLALFSI